MRRWLLFALTLGLMAAGGAHAQVAGYGRGLILDDPITYRSFRAAPRYRAFLPELVDLSDRVPAPDPKGQGAQGSCSAWATTYAARSYLRFAELGHRPQAPSEIMSPAYVFNVAKADPTNCHVGSQVSKILEHMKQTGAVTLAEMPYDETRCDYQVPPELDQSAGRYKIYDWETVNVNSLEDIKGQLAKGRPVIVAMFVTARLSSYRGGLFPFDQDGPYPGMHAMLVVGYDEREGTVKIQNSWGTDWGEAGYLRARYADFMGALKQAWVIVPPPAPPPPPPPARDVYAELQTLIAGLKCAHVSLSRDAAGRITVTGFVGEPEDDQRIRLIAGAGDQPALLDLAVNPWPQCEIRLVAEQAQGGFDVALDRVDASGASAPMPAPETPLLDGDEFRIRVKASDRYAYLLIIYVSADGAATEVYRGPNPGAFGDGLVLGRGGSKAGPKAMNVAGPVFGQEAVVVVGSTDNAPLIDASTRQYESDRDMLSRLRKAIWDRKDSGAIALQWRFLTTAAQGAGG